MKIKIDKGNLLSYILVVIAIIMLSSTLTMAVLTDKKKGKEDIVFGRVAISGRNSLLELEVDDAVTIGTEILNENRYFYFSPTSDTEDMIARFRIEYIADSNDYASQIAILNSTLRSEYFETFSLENDYKYLYQGGYYYLVNSDATEIDLQSMRVIHASESDTKFILSDSYTFNITEKAKQKALFNGLSGAHIKLVVTVDASQREGLSDIEDIWSMLRTVNFYDENGTLLDTLESRTIDVTLPLTTEFGNNTLSVWKDDNGNYYGAGDTISLTDSYSINLTAQWAGVSGSAVMPGSSPIVGISEEPQEEFISWSELIENGFFQVNNGVINYGNISGGTLTGKLYFPGNATSIGANLLYSAGFTTQISDIFIPSGYTSIGNYAFYMKSSIKNVVILDGVTSIGTSVFSNCNNMLTIELPDSIRTIGEYGFYNCQKISYINLNDEIQSIGNYCFQMCNNLEEINIPKNLTVLNRYTFYSCRALKAINIPDSITTIYDSAFGQCLSVTELNLPSSITYLGSNVFDYCTGLESIVVDSANLYFDSRENCNAIIKTATDEILLTCKNTTLPSTIKRLGDCAFKGSDIEYIDLPEDLTYLGREAFSYCTKLKEITIPSGITALVYEEFYGCTDLETVVLPEGMETIGALVFVDCKNLREINLPSTLTKIDQRAFMGCNKLESITLPDSLTEIGSIAFTGCYALKSIRIPKNLEKVVGNPFSGCPNLDSIIVDPENTVFDSRNNCNAMIVTETNELISACVNTVIPDTVTTIGQSAFSSIYRLKSLTIPEGVTKIKNSAFQGCYALREITFPSTLTEVGNSLCSSCYSLFHVTDLSENHLITASKLSLSSSDSAYLEIRYDTTTNFNREFIIEDGCVSILLYSNNSNQLSNIGLTVGNQNKNVVIPNNVKYIHKYAFKDSDITSIKFSSGVLSAGEYAFDGCSDLETVYIDSPDIYTSFMVYSYARAGLNYLVENAQYIYVLKTATNNKTNSYLNDAELFIKTSGTGDYADYWLYTRIISD